MMHLVPTALILAALAMTWGRFHWSAYALIAGPLFLLGLLFEIDWWYARPRAR